MQSSDSAAGVWCNEGSSEAEKVLEDGACVAADPEPAVPVAGPLHRKIYNAKPVHQGAEYDFDIEHEPIRRALRIQLPRDVTTVELEAALRVGQMGRDAHPVQDESLEESGDEFPVPIPVPADNALREFSRSMGQFSTSLTQQAQTGECVLERDGQSAVGEHHVLSLR